MLTLVYLNIILLVLVYKEVAGHVGGKSSKHMRREAIDINIMED